MRGKKGHARKLRMGFGSFVLCQARGNRADVDPGGCSEYAQAFFSATSPELDEQYIENQLVLLTPLCLHW